MSERLPHHPLELYQPPVTAAERIHDELHYGGEGSQLRQCLVHELGRIYHGTELAGSLTKLSVVGATANAETLSLDDEQSISSAEVAAHSAARCTGGMLAIHSILPTFDTKHKRRQILQYDMYEYAHHSMNQEQIAARLLNEYELRNHLFGNMNQDLQLAVITAAEKLYTDYPEQMVYQYQESFMFGYASAHFRINAAADMYDRQINQG